MHKTTDNLSMEQPKLTSKSQLSCVLPLCMLLLLLVPASMTSGLDLSVLSEDMRLEQTNESGYYLYVRKKPEIQSILIVESTKDPSMKADSYAWRNPVFHKENSEEKQKLDGKFLDKKTIFTLIDSTPVDDALYGKAFRIFIPYVVVFGYPWSRYGEIAIMDGTYMNIRTFALPHGDYEGAYQDNPFTLRMTQKPLSGPPEGNYSDETIKTYSNLAKDTDGKTLYSKGEADLLNQIRDILKTANTPDLDLVLCIDATKSMENDVPFLQKELVPLLKDLLSKFKTYRIGIVQYRDYLEEFLYQSSGFTEDFALVQKAIDRIRPAGGRDIPEAVNEALHASLKDFGWKAATRMVILVGDAPPHPIPRGSVTGEMVTKLAKQYNVTIQTIILPQ